MAETDPSRAAYLKLLAYEHCVEGFEWRANEAISFAIGQGDVLVSPLQLASAYASIANGGTLYEPRVAKAMVAADGSSVEMIEPTVKNKVPVSDETIKYLQEALAEVTTSGTGGGAFAGFPQDEVAVAGKTGSADAEGRQVSSWFASYAPVEDPQYAIVVLVSQGGTGGETSAPIAREIYEGIYGFSRSGESEDVERGEPLLPGGKPHTELPVVRSDGSIETLEP